MTNTVRLMNLLVFQAVALLVAEQRQLTSVVVAAFFPVPSTTRIRNSHGAFLSCRWAKKDFSDSNRKSQPNTAHEGKQQQQQQRPPKAIELLNDCTSETQARRLLERELLKSTSDQNGSDSNRVVNVLFGSISIPPGASQKGISDGDLAIQTRLVNRKYQIMELIELTGDRDMDRISWSIFSVFVASSLTALTMQQNLPGPEILRFLVVWILTFLPLALVGYGFLYTDQLQAVLVQVQRGLFPAYRQRMIQHEAGHFLMGHLLGWPIQGYTTNAVKNAVSFYPLQDGDKGRDRARQLGFDRPTQDNDDDYDLWPLPRTVQQSSDTPFFSSEGRGGDLVKERSVLNKSSKQEQYDEFLKLPAQNDPTKAWPFRGFDERTLDQLTVISVAGVCAEILAFGNAEGGMADLSQLRQLFASSDESMTERERDNRIRFSMGYTLSQLRLHLGALDALAAIMDRGGSVAECVWALERCSNVSGQSGILGDYEQKRRKQFQERRSWIEHKTIDAVEDRFTEGKGGGDRKQRMFTMKGDDPLYAAVATSLVFILWASSGGLTLH